jgi:N-dimethylarginine dimethylaminohydrolase
MCRPTYFDVSYAINPWMDPGSPVDRNSAIAQWEELRATYERLGHTVDIIEPIPELPDMVFAANGGFVVDGRVYGAQFRNPERADEAPTFRSWFETARYSYVPHAEARQRRRGRFHRRR